MAAYTKVPSEYMASWAEDGTTITVPIASFDNTDSGSALLTELTAADADGAEGDIAEILMKLLNQVYTVYEDNTAPTKWRLSRSVRTSGATGTVSFSLSFNVTTSGLTAVVQDET